MIGTRFSMLTVKASAGADSKRNLLWLCQCDCGRETVTAGYRLRSGETRSCGCLVGTRVRERNLVHGGSKSRLYAIWLNMRARCEKAYSTSFHGYGARGVHVCDEWKDFSVFRSWANANGYAENLTIDRMDSMQNYTPANCRWATHQEQQEHKRTRKDAKLTSSDAKAIRADSRPAKLLAAVHGVSAGHIRRVRAGKQWKPNHTRIDDMKTFAQGEIYARRLAELPPASTLAQMRDRNAANLPIISHSERGHHHVLDRADIEVLERTADVPAGMRILYAIVTEPTLLKQDAHVPHQPVNLDPGIYEFRIQREYDPLMEQARQVAD